MNIIIINHRDPQFASTTIIIMADNTKGLDDVLNSDERPTKENLVAKFFQLEQSMKILANSLRDMQTIDGLR